MNSVVLAFAGSIASGKSTISTAVATSLGWSRVSFGEYVRSEARLRGLGESRAVLQNLGVSLIDEGCEQFCRAVLAQTGWRLGQSLVVDGLRHVEALQELKRLVAPAKLLLIFIETSEAVRRNRVTERKGADCKELLRIESHSTERQVQAALPQIADITVDGNRPIEDLAQEITGWVMEFG